ncbi:MAG: peptide chain release factor N(5)-glutamine methyltransferase [Oscillospiraceae bacterium]|nr:peptide chain release factor N(5)-glutamine methyltransferase [Oscillospiraceae bacterium]
MTRQEEKWLREYAEKSKQDINKLIERRVNGEPLQYILGEWEFYGYNFKIGKGVLIPRPETEFLVDSAKEYKPELVYDLCAGSGCVGIALAKETGCKVISVDISEEAIKYLKQNIKLNGVEIETIKDDVLNPAETYTESDCILVNPPYLTGLEIQKLQKEVTYEPEIALFGGKDGLDFYRKIFTLWSGKLKKGGLFAVEVGDGQAREVCGFMQNAGLFETPQIIKDYSGIERVVYALKA